MRNDVKRLLKDPKFWQYFPEYPKIEDYKVGCCNMKEETYFKVLGWIKQNPDKWKSYYGTDKLRIFDYGKVVEM